MYAICLSIFYLQLSLSILSDKFCCFCHRFYARPSSKWLSRLKGNVSEVSLFARWVRHLRKVNRIFTGVARELCSVWRWDANKWERNPICRSLSSVCSQKTGLRAHTLYTEILGDYSLHYILVTSYDCLILIWSVRKKCYVFLFKVIWSCANLVPAAGVY